MIFERLMALWARELALRILGITTLIVSLLFFARQFLFRNGVAGERLGLDSEVDAIFAVDII